MQGCLKYTDSIAHLKLYQHDGTKIASYFLLEEMEEEFPVLPMKSVHFDLDQQRLSLWALFQV